MVNAVPHSVFMYVNEVYIYTCIDSCGLRNASTQECIYEASNIEGSHYIHHTCHSQYNCVDAPVLQCDSPNSWEDGMSIIMSKHVCVHVHIFL